MATLTRAEKDALIAGKTREFLRLYGSLVSAGTLREQYVYQGDLYELWYESPRYIPARRQVWKGGWTIHNVRRLPPDDDQPDGDPL